MKLLCLLVACCCFVQAQAQLVLSGKIKNAQAGTPLLANVPFDAWYHQANSVEVQPNAQGEFSVTLLVNRPQTIFLDYAGTRIYLYAEPNATLYLTFQGAAFPDKLVFGGSLKKENAFRQELGLTRYQLGMQTWNDTLTDPDQIIASIGQNQAAALAQIEKKKHAFSPAFYQMTKADIQYFAPAIFWRLVFRNEVWGKKNKSKFDREEWRKALATVHAAQPISNPQAGPSYFYQEVLAYYPLFLQFSNTKEAFANLVEKMFQKPFAEARAEIKEKGERYWEHKALLYGLQGAALESALASFLNNGVYAGELIYQQEAYDDFLVRFPQSAYRPYLAQLMERYRKSQPESSASSIEFEDKANQFQTLEEVLKPHRGKVVYVDLWGSWCGPCREEFGYTQALKERFKNKAVDFVYIAFEHSANPEKTWKETVRFYGLTGRHLLGTEALEKYFMELYAKNGSMVFPSYLLIDKEGKIVNPHAARPSSKETLYKQIANLL